LAHAESGRLSGNIDDRRVEIASRLATRSQQRLHFLQQRRVVGTRLAQERLLRLSRQLQRRLPQIIYAFPAFSIHRKIRASSPCTAWEISRRVLGEDDPRTQFDPVAYAGILDGLQRYDESEAIYRRALAIFEKTFGSEHYEVAGNLHNLAAVLCARGHLQEAEQLYRRSLAIKEKLLGSEKSRCGLDA
jgi:tetratricopeptide (TPR) repeat protein